MSHRNPPPAPPLSHPTISHTSTIQILKQTTSLFYSNFVAFLFLSSLLLTFRSNVYRASHYLTAIIDSDPSLKSLLTSLDSSAAGQTQHRDHLRHRRRRGAFLQLSRLGTLDDDDFSSGDSDFDRSLFHPSSRKALPNASFLSISGLSTAYGFSNPIFDHGISLPKIVRPGAIKFMPKYRNNVSFVEEGEKKPVQSGLDDGKSVIDLNFLIKGFELGRQDATSLFILAGVLSAAYVYVVLLFIVTYTWVNGIVFLKVVEHLLGNHRSLSRTFWDGLNIGIERLSGLILSKWVLKDAMAQLLGIYFFGEIEDQYMFFKVFLRMKLMPFANEAPWLVGHEWESAGFILVWFLSDLIVGFKFSLDTWVAIVDSRRGGREIFKRGYRILMALFHPAFDIRWLEALLCGCVGSWLLRRMFGHVFALIFQSLMEVYFTIAWLVFYFAARYKDDASVGRSFGRREMEGLLEEVR